MLIEEQVRQGIPLLEAVEQTKHLRARDEAPEERAQPAPRATAPPPNMADLGDLQRWNPVR